MDDIEILEKKIKVLRELEKIDSSRKGLTPITHWCSHYAVFYDDNGLYVGKKKIKWKDKFFSWNNRSYNFLPDDSSFFKVTRILSSQRYYFYNVNNAMPLVLDKKLEPVLDNSAYKSILDSDLVKKLNPKKSNFLEFFGSWKGLLLLLVIGAAAYYFLSGGSLTQ